LLLVRLHQVIISVMIHVSDQPRPVVAQRQTNSLMRDVLYRLFGLRRFVYLEGCGPPGRPGTANVHVVWLLHSAN